MPHAAFYVVQHHGLKEKHYGLFWFQCRTQHYMWCNYYRQILVSSNPVSMPHAAFYVVQRPFTSQRCGVEVSMPHAAFYVVQQSEVLPLSSFRQFQCRTQHFMWCNYRKILTVTSAGCFNAARSIICGATENHKGDHRNPVGFNAARSIICGATEWR